MSVPDTVHRSSGVSREAYLTGSRPGIRVPVCELILTAGGTFPLYDTSGSYTGPVHAGGEFTRRGSRIHPPASGT